MKKGDTVKIYADPFGKAGFEGEAILRKFISKNDYDKFEEWMVQFPGEDKGTYRRMIAF